MQNTVLWCNMVGRLHTLVASSVNCIVWSVFITCYTPEYIMKLNGITDALRGLIPYSGILCFDAIIITCNTIILLERHFQRLSKLQQVSMLHQ